MVEDVVFFLVLPYNDILNGGLGNELDKNWVPETDKN